MFQSNSVMRKVFIISLFIASILPLQSKNTMGNMKGEDKKYIELCRTHVCSDYKEMYRKGHEGAFLFPYITPGSKSYANVLWDWDSWLSDVALRQILQDVGSPADKAEALPYEQGCVLNYLAYTDEDGYMPMVVDQNTDPRKIRPADIYHTNMHKPVIAQHAAFLTRIDGGDATWLRDGYAKMQCFMENYYQHHRHTETGLYYWQDDLAIGVDTDPSTFFRPDASSASIYLNCLMYRELLAMAYLAKQLNHKEAELLYSQRAENLKQSVQRYCWDERDGMYYSVDIKLRSTELKPQIIFGHEMTLHEGGPRSYPCLIQRLGVWSGFMALWAGIATDEQARRMVSDNLLCESTFWAPYGVRTLSRLEAMYSMAATHNPSNWNGPIWGISNYMTFRGLVRYGFEREARELALRTVRLYGVDLKQCGELHEYYNPDTGEPIINPGFQNWNYLVLNMIAWLRGTHVVEEF